MGSSAAETSSSWDCQTACILVAEIFTRWDQSNIKMKSIIILSLLVILYIAATEGIYENRCRLYTKSVGDCRRVCQMEKRCKAYTWHENGSCHLKKRLTSKTWKKKSCKECQSGHFLTAKKIKYMKKINLAGGDLEC